ncbi:hypothetical protein [Vibrio harveyi]|uniref:hypothetical protein n=1 Tax=Vibrio harveyi TaxID=669 RepID=UPI003CE9838C
MSIELKPISDDEFKFEPVPATRSDYLLIMFMFLIALFVGFIGYNIEPSNEPTIPVWVIMAPMAIISVFICVFVKVLHDKGERINNYSKYLKTIDRSTLHLITEKDTDADSFAAIKAFLSNPADKQTQH